MVTSYFPAENLIACLMSGNCKKTFANLFYIFKLGKLTNLHKLVETGVGPHLKYIVLE